MIPPSPRPFRIASFTLQSSTGLPFTVTLLGIACFAGMEVLMTGLAIELRAYNAMLWRCAITLPTLAGTALIVMGCLLAAKQGSSHVDHLA